MNTDKTRIFQDFAAKAKRRIEERKQFHTKEYYVKDANVTLTLHGLTEEEISESFDLFEGGDLERDKRQKLWQLKEAFRNTNGTRFQICSASLTADTWQRKC